MKFLGKALSFGSIGDDITNLHKELINLGYTVHADEIGKTFFGKSTQEAVTKFQSEHQLDATGVVDEATVLKWCELTKRNGSLKVSGQVVTNAGVAAADLNVIAIDKNIGKDDVVLGQTVTDSSGNYSISYDKQVLEKMGKQKADIQITIVDPQVKSKIYGVSSVHYNASDEEKINLVLQSKIIDKISEYNKIVSALKQYLGNTLLKDLQENTNRQDISYLANKTGWDARLVAMVSLADKYSAESGISPDFYYALFRAGISTDLDELYRTNSETVKRIWEKAIEENIIDVSLKPTIEKNLIKFKENARTHVLEKAKPVGVSSLKNMLDISLPDRKKQNEFVDLYLNHTGDMNIFWNKIETKFGKNTAEKLQLDGKLGNLTNNNTELIKKLYSDKLAQNSLSDLIKNGLYKKDAWIDILKNDIPVPKDISGETDEEKKKNYADFMVSQLKSSYPTLFAAEVYHKEIQKNVDSDVPNEVYKFLQDNHEKYEIGVQPLGKILQDNPDIMPRDEVFKELKKLERVYQISPSDDSMKVLWAKNIDSAFSVIQYGEKEFIGNFQKDLGGEETAKIIYAKAHKVHSIVLNMAISYLTNRTTPNLYAITGSNERVTAK